MNSLICSFTSAARYSWLTKPWCLGLLGLTLAMSVQAQEQFPVFPPTQSTNWSFTGTQSERIAGSIDAAGDVNGDGCDDIIIGRGGSGYTVYAFWGSNTGLSTVANWFVTRSSTITSFGDQVAGAGDVNGDGYDDVLVGAPSYSIDLPYEGYAYLYKGGPTGLAKTHSWAATGGGSCGESDGGFGKSMAAAGDVNGDGYGDVIIGALKYKNPNLSFGGNKDGQAWVFYGSPTGLATTANWTIKSTQYASGLGSDVAGAGDVNGDGYDDVVIGEWNWDEGGDVGIGRIRIFAGSTNGLSTSPLSTVVGEPSSVSPTWFGLYVAGAGDVNGDGYDDVLVGSHYYRVLGDTQNRGRAYLYYGSPTGLVVTSDTNHPQYRWALTGAPPQLNVGIWVAGLGDVNGDRLSDIAVGYRQQNPIEGYALLFTGSRSVLSQVAAWTNSVILPNYSGWTGARAGDLTGSGKAGIILGAPYWSDPFLNSGRVWAFMNNYQRVNGPMMMLR